MGYKYDRDELLGAAVLMAYDEGLSRLTFGKLARRLGIHDRAIVYYFPTKNELIAETAFAIGAEFQAVLAEAFGDEPLAPDELGRRAWPVLSAADAEPVLAVFFEVVGLGAARISPFDELAPALIEGWIDWLGPRIDAEEPEAAAEALIAQLDGLLLLRTVLGDDRGELGARALGLAES
ncbi:MAG: TetR/AcrR family transcriptional regulator [Actinomycetota bacterium]